MKKTAILTLVIGALSLSSCTNDDNNMVDDMTKAELKINIDNLEPLGDDYQYEGWIIVDGKPVSTGTFTSLQTSQSFMVNKMQLEKASKFVLSIEPKNDNDPAPSNTKLLAGDFSGNKAMVSTTNMLGDLTTAMGKFILATPTSESMTDEDSGVWFLDPSSTSPKAGLTLPELPMGWEYEGWVVIDGKPISSGKFTHTNMADMNAKTSIYKGMDGDGPAFPGEDFVKGSYMDITFPHSLQGSMVVISVEPKPDNSPMPFALKPLAKLIPSDAKSHSLIPMMAGPMTMISGHVTR